VTRRSRSAYGRVPLPIEQIVRSVWDELFPEHTHGVSACLSRSREPGAVSAARQPSTERRRGAPCRTISTTSAGHGVVGEGEHRPYGLVGRRRLRALFSALIRFSASAWRASWAARNSERRSSRSRSSSSTSGWVRAWAQARAQPRVPSPLPWRGLPATCVGARPVRDLARAPLHGSWA